MSQVDVQFFENMFVSMLFGNEKSDEKKAVMKTEKGDEVDQATLDREAGMALKLQHREKKYMVKVKGALQRIKDGEFGMCQECGSDISFNRLLARPTAEFCISCKEEMERAEGHTLKKKDEAGDGVFSSAANYQVH